VDVNLILNQINRQFISFRKTQLENQINEQTPTPDIVCWDVLGELKKLYSISTISIICSSFLPAYFGYSFVGPAHFSKPIIIGPYMRNFLNLVELFVQKKGVFQVNDKIELMQIIKQLLENADLRHEYGKNAYDLLQKNCGSLKRTISVIDQILIKEEIKHGFKSSVRKMG
jgi:3-deoxy-D-manno-octulosonic-acid transferase